MKPLLLIKIGELLVDRAKPIRETLCHIESMIINLEETKKNLSIAFTHVEDGFKQEQIISKLLDLSNAKDIKNNKSL